MVRAVIADERDRLQAGARPLTEDELAEAVVERIDAFTDPDLVLPPRVVNATGVILHTNLGRAPWPRAARLAAIAGASGYGYLELDLDSGRRGARFPAVEEAICARHRRRGRPRRDQQRGGAPARGGPRRASGRDRGLTGRARGDRRRGADPGDRSHGPAARLVEVGTTNRTRAADYEAALAAGQAKVVLRVHPSNFAMHGFTESADPAEVAAIAHRHGAIVIDDLGSGALLDTAAYGLAHEPMPSERLEAGADVVPVQRRQARRWAAGRDRRRPPGPRRTHAA